MEKGFKEFKEKIISIALKNKACEGPYAEAVDSKNRRLKNKNNS